MNTDYAAWEKYERLYEKHEAAKEKKDLEKQSEANFEKYLLDEKARRDEHMKRPHPLPEKFDNETDEENMWRCVLEAKTRGQALYAVGKRYELNQALEEWGRASLSCIRLQNWRRYQKPKLECADKPSGPSPEEVCDMLVKLYCNLALVYYLKGDYHQVILMCDQALDIDPKCIKALYRRACACEATENVGDALLNVEALKEIDPGNAAILQLEMRLKRHQEVVKPLSADNFKSKSRKFRKVKQTDEDDEATCKHDDKENNEASCVADEPADSAAECGVSEETEKYDREPGQGRGSILDDHENLWKQILQIVTCNKRKTT